MSNKMMNSRIAAYKKAFASGEIQKTYQSLVSIVQGLRTDFSKAYKGTYTIANVLHGYIDFTYFYLQNDFLKERKLKFAIVFNHQKAHFEIWLLGQTKDVQIAYWEKLKNSKWVSGEEMPVYSIFEVILLPNPDFDHVHQLSKSIQSAFGLISKDIISALQEFE